jgi:hypothetical protein
MPWSSGRDRAYDYLPTAVDRSNFDYYTRVAALAPGQPVTVDGSHLRHGYSEAEIDAARVKVKGGHEAYITCVRKQRISWFETAKLEGRFEPRVLAQSMTRHNAAKAARGFGTRVLAIVEAEKEGE